MTLKTIAGVQRSKGSKGVLPALVSLELELELPASIFHKQGRARQTQ